MSTYLDPRDPDAWIEDPQNPNEDIRNRDRTEPTSGKYTLSSEPNEEKVDCLERKELN